MFSYVLIQSKVLTLLFDLIFILNYSNLYIIFEFIIFSQKNVKSILETPWLIVS